MNTTNLNKLHNDSKVTDSTFEIGFNDSGRMRLVYSHPYTEQRYECGTDEYANFTDESLPKDVQDAFSLFNALPKGQALTSSLLEQRRVGAESGMQRARAEFKARKGFVDLDTITNRLFNHLEKTVRVGTSTLHLQDSDLTRERQYVLVRLYAVTDRLGVFNGTGESTPANEVRLSPDEWDVDPDDSGEGGDIECWSGEVIDISEAGGWKGGDV